MKLQQMLIYLESMREIKKLRALRKTSGHGTKREPGSLRVFPFPHLENDSSGKSFVLEVIYLLSKDRKIALEIK
jgi:hypothetical protein